MFESFLFESKELSVQGLAGFWISAQVARYSVEISLKMPVYSSKLRIISSFRLASRAPVRTSTAC